MEPSAEALLQCSRLLEDYNVLDYFWITGIWPELGAGHQDGKKIAIKQFKMICLGYLTRKPFFEFHTEDLSSFSRRYENRFLDLAEIPAGGDGFEQPTEYSSNCSQVWLLVGSETGSNMCFEGCVFL